MTRYGPACLVSPRTNRHAVMSVCIASTSSSIRLIDFHQDVEREDEESTEPVTETVKKGCELAYGAFGTGFTGSHQGAGRTSNAASICSREPEPISRMICFTRAMVV